MFESWASARCSGCLGEQATAALKGWGLLRKLSCSTNPDHRHRESRRRPAPRLNMRPKRAPSSLAQHRFWELPYKQTPFAFRTQTPRALLRLARRRINVLFAMLRDGTFYEPRTPTVTLAA
ncbi:hypothetical protein GCM10010342_27310 [Streptomyces anulatus]|nr:hypothetical protein GCM10010342_27310 [Streptomyces anulatus]